ncbi:hypothetical protein ALC56_12673 [Trachymyrmex septentrionalis]|uniref:Uncharacterized protein n=1 Tax=Trachymyrmex septentrionalis TaxID=34720 RepID=A0A195EYT0_9HYME|nr:hypothetical protein ALC56_12673 [Trachymyrmex septentrionalis]
MSSACEDSCPWTNYLSEAINKYVLNLFSFLSTFGLTFNFGDIVIIDDETSLKLREFLHELIALLSFDDFQLQLLKVFLLTFLSSVALIFVAWYIYGSRITEQFMKTGKIARTLFPFARNYKSHYYVKDINHLYLFDILILYLRNI